MKDALQATNQTFESSTSRTPEYLAWHRHFKKAFTKFLQSKGATKIEIGSPNHFDMSGFFTVGTQAWYFRIEDLRWSKDRMLVRTAAGYKDFTGGMNRFVSLTNETQFGRDWNCHPGLS